MKQSVSLLLLATLVTIMVVGCATSSPLWSQAHTNGQNQIFSANINGRGMQKCVWVSAIGYPEHHAQHQAHQKGLRILGNNAYDVDIKITHRNDGRCRVDMLMTTQ